MSATDRKSIIFQIMSVIETGRARGNAGTVAILHDGAGISYGIHQATDRSGSLDLVVLRYLDLVGGDPALAAWLPYLSESRSTKQDPNNPDRETSQFMALLSALGTHPMMERAQHDIFTQHYWNPSVKQWRTMKLSTALSLAVVYDTHVQSGPKGLMRIRRRFRAVPPAQGGGEREWVEAYLYARRAWLLGHPNADVNRSVYRIDLFLELLADGRWTLDPPFVVRGQPIVDDRVC